MTAEQIRDTLRTHIFVNRQHEIAGLDEAAQAVLALFAVPAPAEPVAWRSRHKDDPKDYWSYHEYPLGQDDCEQQQALYVAPQPVGADAMREALQTEIDKWETDARYLHPDNEVLASLDRIRAASQK